MIALAGPAVNVVIVLLLFTVFGARLDPERAVAAVEDQKIDFTTRLAVVNVMLVAFNMIPAFPMDGGRVLRALLSYRLDRARATRIAASIGQAVAFGLGFLGASHETYAVELGEATKGVATRKATITSFTTLDTQATIRQAVDALLATTQREFPITDGGKRLRGLDTRWHTVPWRRPGRILQCST